MPDMLDDHIIRIGKKFQILLSRYTDLKKKSTKMEMENQGLKTNKIEMEERIAQLEQQVAILKVSADKLEGEERKKFEKNINTFIKTIDNAIATISH